MTPKPCKLVLVTALFVGGCVADFRQPIGGESMAPLSPEEARYQALEQKLADLNRRVQNLNLAATSQDNLRLEEEMRGLRGEVERLSYLVETSEKRSRELYVDLDRRLSQLENEGRSARLALDSNLPRLPAASGQAPGQGGAAAPAAPATPEEESAYLQVFDQLKAGRYDEAITGFRSMLERWPSGRYADNAWYWLGESYYVKRDFTAARTAFQTLLEQYPHSGKRADAMFKLGMSLIELKQKDAARTALQQVVQEHPQSNAANLARQRLAQLQ